ncbi:MAG: DUF2189 domain-containing protein, partial [Pseudomonadota bacterium]
MTDAPANPTTADDHAPPSPPPIANEISVDDVRAALREGWADFKRAPAFGLVFSFFYVLGGALILMQAAILDLGWMPIILACGFPLLGPFVAVGLYEVSRRMEAGEPLDWGPILTVAFRHKDGGIPAYAVLAILLFLFWVYLAHLVFALFFGLSAMTNISTGFDIFISFRGFLMLAIGTAVGAAVALFLFATSVLGLPLLLEREIDIVTASFFSAKTVAKQPRPMLTFGVIVAVATFAAMIPFFLGLFIVMPVLGHATWRLYRKAVRFESGSAPTAPADQVLT